MPIPTKPNEQRIRRESGMYYCEIFRNEVFRNDFYYICTAF